MTGHDALGRELTAWFGDIAAPRIPDYTDDIVRATAGQRQRPSWAFAERWLPMPVDTLHRVPSTPIPWRTIGLLAVIAALLISLVIVSVGSTRRVAEPFGLAANGLVTYAAVGDIWVVDPKTGSRRAIATGPEQDQDPRWSPDGSSIAFLRLVHGAEQVVIVSADGRGPTVVGSRSLGNVDPDSFKWSPDSETVLLAADFSGMRALVLVDADDGAVTTLPVDYAELEAFWRPPDGRELLFASGYGAKRALTLYPLDTGIPRDVPLTVEPGEELRPMGWTPDGERVLVNRWVGDRPQTFVVDPETGLDHVLDVGYGHVSNAGDRVAGTREWLDEAFCIVDIDGGPCVGVGIGDGWAQPGGMHFTSLQWSPDDRWIVVQPLDGSQPVLFDAISGEMATDADWLKSGADSWRRDAP